MWLNFKPDAHIYIVCQLMLAFEDMRDMKTSKSQFLSLRPSDLLRAMRCKL